MSHPLYPPVSPLKVAWRHCCPRCGEGSLYVKFLKITPECAVCKLDLSKADAADGPAVFIMMILGTILSGVIVVLEFQFAPPFWVHMLVALVICGIGAYTLLPFFKSLLVALQYRMQSGDSEENRIED